MEGTPPASPPDPPPDVTVAALLARFDGFLLDAYGVLNDEDGALPGAAEFLARLAGAGKRVCVISNDASKSIETTWRRYTGFGLPLAREQILTSGALLPEYFAQAGLRGKPCLVLGTRDAEDYVRQAGGRQVALDDERAEVLVVADDQGFDLLPALNQVVTVLLRRLARGQRTALIVPNPDLVYPRRGGYGVTAGAFAELIERVLDLRDPGGGHRFVRLGKPAAPIYRAGLARLGDVPVERVVMVGDQLLTDVRGALELGLRAALRLGGVSVREDVARLGIRPSYILPSLA